MKKIVKLAASFLLIFAVVLGTVAVPGIIGAPMEVEAAANDYCPITARTLNGSGRVTTYRDYSTKDVYFRDKASCQAQGYVFSMGYFGQSSTRASSRVTGYKLSNSDGYIDCKSDTIYIIQIIDNAIAYVKYPVPGGYKYRYVYLKDLMLGGVAPSETHIANAKLTTYRYSTGNTTFGSVYKNDRVIYIGRANGRVQFLYPVSGGYKCAFVSEYNWNRYFSRV